MRAPGTAARLRFCRTGRTLVTMSDAIELIYDRNVADEKLKSGTKYERLAAIVFKILDEGSVVTHDVRLRGDAKKSLHQIDVSVQRAGTVRRLVIECRDKADAPIRLGAVRDFKGAVIQLDADAVLLATTRFTKPAQVYGDEEGIQLGTLKPFDPDTDWEGRVQRIVLHVTAFIRDDPPSVELRIPEGADTSSIAEGLTHVTESVRQRRWTNGARRG